MKNFNYSNPNSKLLEAFCEDWPEPTMDEENADEDIAAACLAEDEANATTEEPVAEGILSAAQSVIGGVADGAKELLCDAEAEETEMNEEEAEEVEAEETEEENEVVLKAFEALKAEADELFHKNEDGNVIEDDEFNEGINAVLALLDTDEPVGEGEEPEEAEEAEEADDDAE